MNTIQNKRAGLISSQDGFTMIELLVVITIVGILMLAALFSFGKAALHMQLTSSVEKVVADLKFEQNRVKSGEVSTIADETEVRCRGYVFSLADEYTRLEFDYEQASGCDVVSTSYDNPDQSLEQGVEISNVSVYQGTNLEYDGVSMQVLFMPPEGEVMFRDPTGGNDYSQMTHVELEFVQTNADDLMSKTVTINRSGQVTY